jgi:integrase
MCGKKNQLGDPLSPNTIGQVITMSKQVFGDAIKHNLIRFNPAENVEVPKRIKPKVEPPGKADVLAVLEQVTPEFKLLFLMNSLTGLRRGQILALQWRDIDWLNGEISVCLQGQGY